MHLQEIKDKCEQYWNVPRIGPEEVHAILEFIYDRACVAQLELRERTRWMDALAEAGIGDWEDYDHASQIMDLTSGESVV